MSGFRPPDRQGGTSLTDAAMNSARLTAGLAGKEPAVGRDSTPLVARPVSWDNSAADCRHPRPAVACSLRARLGCTQSASSARRSCGLRIRIAPTLRSGRTCFRSPLTSTSAPPASATAMIRSSAGSPLSAGTSAGTGAMTVASPSVSARIPSTAGSSTTRRRWRQLSASGFRYSTCGSPSKSKLFS